MARRSLKVTGFARFFLVMVIVAPLAYVGASYYNGKDGIQELKNLLGIESGNVTEKEQAYDLETEQSAQPVNQAPSSKALEEENLRLKDELEYKTKRVEELFKENEELRRKVEMLEKAGNVN